MNFLYSRERQVTGTITINFEKVVYSLGPNMVPAQLIVKRRGLSLDKILGEIMVSMFYRGVTEIQLIDNTERTTK
jgi:hypothetical protein